MPTDVISIADLAPYLSGNATAGSLQEDVGMLEKLVLGLILADVVLFMLLVCAVFFACKSYCRPYARDSIPYASVDINVPQKIPISDPGRCGLQS